MLERRQASGIDIDAAAAQEQLGTLPAFDGNLDTTLRVARLGVVLKQLRPKFEPACLEFYKTERSVRTASSEQVRQPIYKEETEQCVTLSPGSGHLRRHSETSSSSDEDHRIEASNKLPLANKSLYGSTVGDRRVVPPQK